METEQMVPLAAADLMARSSSVVSSCKVMAHEAVMVDNEESNVAAEYVDSLFADYTKISKKTIVAFGELAAAGDHGKSL